MVSSSYWLDKEEAMLGAVPGAMAAILALIIIPKHHHKNCYFSYYSFNRIDLWLDLLLAQIKQLLRSLHYLK